MSSLERFTRQLGLLNQDWFLTNRISLIGAGNLGSPLGLNISKVGFREVYIYDPDYIEAHNVPNQLFTSDSVRKPKVQSLVNFMYKQRPSNVQFIGWRKKVSLNSPMLFDSEIMVVQTDNIKSRLETFILTLLYNDVYKYNFRYFIEAGTHAYTSKIYIVDLQDKKQVSLYFEKIYERLLAPSQDLPCTERSTFFYANFISSVIMGYLRNLSVGDSIPYETWIDLKNNQVLPFPAGKPVSTWNYKEMLEKYNDTSIGDILTTINSYGPVYSQERFDRYVYDNKFTTGGSDFLFFLSQTSDVKDNTLKVKDGLIRLKVSKSRSMKSRQKNCEWCSCNQCSGRRGCEFRPCQNSRGCGQDGKGRVVFCEKSSNEKTYSQYWKYTYFAMKGKKASDYLKTIKNFIKEWTGFDWK